MPTASYQQMLQSCCHAIIDKGTITPAVSSIEESELTRIIADVRRFQEWVKQTMIQAEFQWLYHIGHAMNINQTRRQQCQPMEVLLLNGREKTIAFRVYLLFRDHTGALDHLKGIIPEDFWRISQKSFDELLLTIEGEYAPFIDFGDDAQLWLKFDKGNNDAELDEWDV